MGKTVAVARGCGMLYDRYNRIRYDMNGVG